MKIFDGGYSTEDIGRRIFDVIDGGYLMVASCPFALLVCFARSLCPFALPVCFAHLLFPLALSACSARLFRLLAPPACSALLVCLLVCSLVCSLVCLLCLFWDMFCRDCRGGCGVDF